MKTTARGSGLTAGLLDRLGERYAQAMRRARETGEPTLAWVSEELDRVDLPDTATITRSGQAQWLWRRPSEAVQLSGVGIAWRAIVDGTDRFERAALAWRRIAEQRGGDTSGGPVAFGGFSFSSGGPRGEEWAAFPAGEISVPRVAVVTEGERHRVVLAAAAQPDENGTGELEATLALAVRSNSEAPAGVDARASIEDGHAGVAEWKRSVAEAAAAVREGTLRKVVLARRVGLRVVSWDPASALARLAETHPDCTIFAVAREDALFCGATPERLARVRRGHVEAMALAGSAARGRDEREDARLARTLLASDKEREEHRAVVDRLCDALGDLCEEFDVDALPTVMRTADIQHLHTALRGRLRQPTTILEVAGRLHPTPAVAGVPLDGALDWIRSHESLDRGWYAGAVGWVNRDGEGDFAVAIRSALVTGQSALVFAGCGIVAGSDPEREYQESQIKMRPMMRALGVSQRIAGSRR